MQEKLVPLNVETINTLSEEVILGNIATSIERGLPVYKKQEEQSGPAIVCAGGPSIKNFFKEIEYRQSCGGTVFAINGTYDLLVKHGVVPDYCVLLDGDERVVEFCKNPIKGTKWLVASQCNPKVLDALSNEEVILWHALCAEELGKKQFQLLKDKGQGHLVAGGSTASLRTLSLAMCWGFRHFFLYGLDSSYSEDKYAYDWENASEVIEVYSYGKKFYTTYGLIAQTTSLLEIAKQFPFIKWEVRGSGLLPWALRTELEKNIENLCSPDVG